MELPIILALGLGAMWFMTRKSRMQQKTAADFRANLAPGQEVMTGSGLFATIVAVEDDVVTLETSPGVTSRWLRPAIAKLVDPPVVDDEVDEDDDADLDEDDELAPDDATDESDAEVDGSQVDVPDDASSLMKDPGEGDTPRR